MNHCPLEHHSTVLNYKQCGICCIRCISLHRIDDDDNGYWGQVQAQVRCSLLYSMSSMLDCDKSTYGDVATMQ
jgi:hypothetical protein